MKRTGLLALAATTMVAGPMLAPAQPVHAQIPAFLPSKDSVPAGDPMDIDGDWRVDTIGKVIRIDRGRAYAVDGWIHALVLSVRPNMVTIRNIQRVSDGVYVGDDLPLMGRVTMRVVSPDRIEASVPGLFGATRYNLIRVTGAGNPRVDGPPMFVGTPRPDGPSQAGAIGQGDRPQPAFASLSQAFGEPRPVTETFQGCAIPKSARRNLLAKAPDEEPQEPRDRMTNRQFAPVADDSNDKTTPDAGDLCWTRLDGVWVENRDAVFDTARNDGRQWDVQNSPLAGLLHGNYTTPETLFIAPGDNENELWVMSGTNELRFTRFLSEDDKTIADLIGQTGVSKIYRAEGRSIFGGELTIDYTAGEQLRIRFGRRHFLRPPTATNNDLSMDDVFVIQYQTDNFAANLKGYNVLTQDPFLLMNNDMGEIFARRDRDEYRIQEKYAVPFGFSLRNELLQGNVFRSTIVSSEREMQEATSSGFGVNATISTSGAVNSFLAFVPGTGQIADTGYSVGYSSTRSAMQTMRQNQSVAQVVGYSRAKSYAILVDHAQTRLSADFLTAVGDAQNEGGYRELIDRFGTHYAYAVTYGASAKMTRDITNEAFSETLSETEGDRLEGEARLLGSSIGGFTEGMRTGVNSSGRSIGNEGGRFVAVGGNGSWDSSGYSRGDRVAPILLDLRPLDELLNPINFPDQPDVYTRVRAELGQAINRYLASQARPLSNDRLISRVTYTAPPPEPEPEPGPQIEEWHVYVPQINCRKVGVGTTNEVVGTIRITSAGGTPNGFAQSKELRTDCERGGSGAKKKYSYRASDNEPGLMILRGTRDQIRRYQLKFDFSWKYRGVTNGKNRTSSRTLASTPMQGGGLEIDKSHTTTWTVSPKRRPEVKLKLRVKRIK